MKKVTYIEMFTFIIGLSLVSFGGGYITIPMLRKKFVEEKPVLTEDKLQDLAAIAQSSPGSISCSLSTGVAYEIGGLSMMLVAFAAIILPPLFIISLISVFYDTLMSQALVQSIFKGLEIGVAVIMVILVKDMMVSLYKRDHKIAMVFLACSILLNFALKLHVIFILIFNLIAVFCAYFYEQRSTV